MYTLDVAFGPDDYIMFGKESAGIPEEILVENEDTCIRIPMQDKNPFPEFKQFSCDCAL